jgi:hypothetical protein
LWSEYPGGKMSRIKKFWIFVFIFAITTYCYAADFKADQPIVLTSAGQSADVLMVKILAQKANLQFSYDKLAKVDALADHATLILVSGGSSKGLGAAKIDKDQELQRVQNLITAAKKNKMTIVTMHVGGKARRGKLSDQFNQLTAENADCLIIEKSGDEDQLFSNIAKEKEIPIYEIDKILDAENILKQIFSQQ